MHSQELEQFIYVVGEKQTTIVQEDPEILAFTQQQMQQIDSGELSLVLANVFGRGQLFPGPDAALTSIIHEYARRSEQYHQGAAREPRGRCTLVTVFKRMDGEMAVRVTAVIPVKENTLRHAEPDQFHTFLLESLPGFQGALTTEAYASDSRIIAIVKEATLYHINNQIN